MTPDGPASSAPARVGCERTLRTHSTLAPNPAATEREERNTPALITPQLRQTVRKTHTLGLLSGRRGPQPTKQIEEPQQRYIARMGACSQLENQQFKNYSHTEDTSPRGVRPEGASQNGDTPTRRPELGARSISPWSRRTRWTDLRLLAGRPVAGECGGVRRRAAQ